MLLQDGQILLADNNRSVNEDYVYEDDWEEELEVSVEDSRGRDDKEEAQSGNFSHVSGNSYNRMFTFVFSSFIHPFKQPHINIRTLDKHICLSEKICENIYSSEIYKMVNKQVCIVFCTV
jgi:hypothetical protein